jgi:Ca-activated chloride channel homolog
MIARASINFIWPLMLWVLLLVPVVVLAWRRTMARRARMTDQYASLEMVGTTPGSNSRLRGRLPPLLMLLALVFFLLALARPQAALMLPARVESVILAMDVSGSMRADDIKPNRLKAAQDAARTFIGEQPRHVRVGLVEIASAAALVLAPTTDRDALLNAIEKVQLQKGTALGSGMVVALATLLPDAGIDVEQLITGRPTPGFGPQKSAEEKAKEKEAAKPVPAGSNGATAIVLLSDGSSNIGPDPLKMADLAAEKGVKVYTIGIGTPEGSTLKADGWSVRVRLDEEVLKKIALTTNGDYFRAATARELNKIYANLSTRLALEKVQAVEVSALLAALGAMFAMVSALLSMLWFNRIL